MGSRLHVHIKVQGACRTGSSMRLVLDLSGSGYGFIFEFGRARSDLRGSSALLRLKRGLILPGSPSPSVLGDAAVSSSKTKIQARTAVRAPATLTHLLEKPTFIS